MKKTALYAAASLAVVIPHAALVAQTTGLGFTAPHVSARAAVIAPTRGDIIFESTSSVAGGLFWGYFGPDWVQFGNPAQQTRSLAAEVDCTTTPPTSPPARQIGGTWLINPTGSAGRCTFEFSGLNGAPICTATPVGSTGGNSVVGIVRLNGTLIELLVWNSTNGGAFPSRLNLVCIASP